MDAAEAAETASFSDLFNARCVQLGLLSAPEIAARIVEVQPAMGRVDLARSVRNWQAGRNLPRPDFYRVVLTALGVDADPDTRETWNRAYGNARVAKNASPPEEPSGPPAADRPMPPAARADARTAETKRVLEPTPTVLSNSRNYLRWGAAALLVLLVVSIAGVGWSVRAASAGASCDMAAAARWDPDRNEAVSALDFMDLRLSAIEACENAVRYDPDKGRYWFQLGRAYDRDAKWHGNYTDAYWAFRRASELGYSAAALSLGLLYEEGRLDRGDGQERGPNLRAAAAFYERAASDGLPMGQYCHAIATLFGWSGAAPDAVSATRLAEAAAGGGSNRALALAADLRARKQSTRHTGCSREQGLADAPGTVRWDGRETGHLSGTASRSGRAQARA